MYIDEQLIRVTLPNPAYYTRELIVPGDYYVKGTFSSKLFICSEIYPVKTMKFRIEKVNTKDYKTTWTSLKIQILEYQNGMETPIVESTYASGNFYNAYKDAEYEASGYWQKTNAGLFFNIVEAIHIKQSSEKLLYEYLVNIFNGLRIKKACIQEVIQKYGNNTLSKLQTAPDIELFTIFKSKKQIDKIRTAVKTYENQEQALVYLTEHQFSSSQIMRIIEDLGVNSYNKIIANPAILLKYEELPSKLIDNLIELEHIAVNDKLRIKGFILRYMKYIQEAYGDIYCEKSVFTANDETSFRNYLLQYGVFTEAPTEIEVLNQLDELVTERAIVSAPLLDSPEIIAYYPKNMFQCEENIANKIAKMLSTKASSIIPKAIIEKVCAAVSGIDPLQKQAVYMALENKISILSGGPGTGKTQTIKMIVEALKTKPELKIELCAPTGKASRKMNEVIGLPASTIHRRLSLASTETETTIDADFVIVDESSMIDIELFSRLLMALPDKTWLLIVGDYAQLPSVGPGLILRDLMDSGKVPVTILKTIFRQGKGSAIIDAAYAVLEGDASKIKNKVADDFVFYNTSKDQNIKDVIANYINLFLKHKADSEQIQILTPENNGDIGTIGLNNLCRPILNPFGGNELMLSPVKKFSTGDRVIQTKNNYELEVFNGSIGTVEEISTKTQSMFVKYQNEVVEYSRDDLYDLLPGYAITVHKSQGSEFDFVIMPISMEHKTVLNRNLLYTALTRAKKKMILVGERKALEYAIGKVSHMARKSQIKQKLMKLC